MRLNRRQKYWVKHNQKRIYFDLCILAGGLLGAYLGWYQIGPAVHKAMQPQPIISPCPASGCSVEPTNTPTPTATPMPPKRPTTGKASYYSIEGCIGCHPDRIMANGERLDDNRLTIAYNHAPLNTPVKITNTINGKSVVATITDTGGFERHGKIADLSVATRDALGCGDVCHVALEL